jgi:hypothetical protein
LVLSNPRRTKPNNGGRDEKKYQPAVGNIDFIFENKKIKIKKEETNNKENEINAI